MPKILLPTKDNKTLKDCEGQKPPVARGSYLEFELSQDEFRFWKSITNEEREKLRDEAFERCFYDVLREFMRTHPRNTGSLFGHKS